MYLLSRFSIFVLLLTAAVSGLTAQEDLPPAGRGGRGGGNTREFLGLGPPPDAAAAAAEKSYTLRIAASATGKRHAARRARTWCARRWCCMTKKAS